MRRKRTRAELDVMIGKIVGTIKKSYAKPMNIEKLSRETGITQDFLKRRVKQIVGYSPSQMITIARLRQVQRLKEIDPNATLTELAERAGFRNYQTFYRSVIRFHSEAPEKYFRMNGTSSDRSAHLGNLSR